MVGGAGIAADEEDTLGVGQQRLQFGAGGSRLNGPFLLLFESVPETLFLEDIIFIFRRRLVDRHDEAHQVRHVPIGLEADRIVALLQIQRAVGLPDQMLGGKAAGYLTQDRCLASSAIEQQSAGTPLTCGVTKMDEIRSGLFDGGRPLLEPSCTAADDQVAVSGVRRNHVGRFGRQSLAKDNDITGRSGLRRNRRCRGH